MARMAKALLGVVGVVGLAGCWPMPAASPERTSHNPFESEITPATVASLREVWRWTPQQEEAGLTGPVSAPVTSTGGVHVTVPCALITLDPADGTVRWAGIIPGTAEWCFNAPRPIFTSEPYVTDAGDGPKVVAGVGATRTRPPGVVESSWVGGAFDVATGQRSEPGVVPFVEAARGGWSAGVTYGSTGPLTVGNTLSLAEVGGAQRAFLLDLSGSSHGLTLGADRVFDVGMGTLASAPGDPRVGVGVRAFSLTESRPGCGPIDGPAGDLFVQCPLWANPLAGAAASVPVIGEAGTRLYVVSSGSLYALDTATGETLWTADVGAAAPPALADGVLLVPTTDGRVVALAAAGCGAATCTPRWEVSVGDAGVATPVVAGGVLYARSGGSVHAFDLAACAGGSCSSLWTAPSDVRPVVSDGRLYTRTGDTLIAHAPG